MSPPAVPLSTPQDSLSLTIRLAQKLCSPPMSEDPRACLLKQSTSSLLNAYEQDKLSHGTQLLDRPLLPILDPIDITAHPIEMLSDSNVIGDAKVLMGVTADETFGFVDEFIPQDIIAPFSDILL